MFRLFLCIMALSIPLGAKNIRPYQKPKPALAMVPIQEGCELSLNWDVEKELTDKFLDVFSFHKQVQVSPLGNFSYAINETKDCDYFGHNLKFANHFSDNDFLMVTELITHKTLPYDKQRFPDLVLQRGYGSCDVLYLGMRVRVIDLRSEEPEIILQEFFENKELVSPSEQKINYNLITPDHPLWVKTPCCRAYRALAKQAVEAAQDAILANW